MASDFGFFCEEQDCIYEGMDFGGYGSTCNADGSNYADTLRIVANDAAFSCCGGRLGGNQSSKREKPARWRGGGTPRLTGRCARRLVVGHNRGRRLDDVARGVPDTLRERRGLLLLVVRGRVRRRGPLRGNQSFTAPSDPLVASPQVDKNGGEVCADVVNRSTIAWNAYRHFGVPHLHNRGLPLRHIRPGQALEYEQPQKVRPLIQQGVVHCDPDLDAIQRLTMSPALTSDVKFSEDSTMLAFPPRAFHPINSQNTVFLREGFWALLLPLTTLWREGDIFRGYWSQRLMWEIGGSLVMTGPTAYQLRNPHDFFLDYNMEHLMYRRTELLLEELNRWECPPNQDLAGCIQTLMSHLHEEGFIGLTSEGIVSQEEEDTRGKTDKKSSPLIFLTL